MNHGKNQKRAKKRGQKSKSKPNNLKTYPGCTTMDWLSWLDGAQEMVSQCHMEWVNPKKVGNINGQQRD